MSTIKETITQELELEWGEFTVFYMVYAIGTVENETNDQADIAMTGNMLTISKGSYQVQADLGPLIQKMAKLVLAENPDIQPDGFDVSLLSRFD